MQLIPTVINSMFNSYPEEMAGINYEDFFTAWALKTGVPQAIRQNKEGFPSVPQGAFLCLRVCSLILQSEGYW